MGGGGAAAGNGASVACLWRRDVGEDEVGGAVQGGAVDFAGGDDL